MKTIFHLAAATLRCNATLNFNTKDGKAWTASKANADEVLLFMEGTLIATINPDLGETKVEPNLGILTTKKAEIAIKNFSTDTDWQFFWERAIRKNLDETLAKAQQNRMEALDILLSTL